MALAMRRPYEDELLGTLIVQYLADEKVAHQYAFLRSMLDCKTSSLVFMPSGLQRLSEETYGYWHMTETEIAQTVTPAPYFVASSSPRVSKSVLEVMKSSATKVRNRCGLGFGRYSELKCLRYCRQCVRKDVEEGRQPYFHRVHQLPGVAVCPKHEALLVSSDLVASKLHIDGAKGIASAFCTEQELNFRPSSEREMEAAIQVAKRSEETLVHAAPSSLFDLRLHYKQCLNRADYLYKGGGCRLDELSCDIVSYFGKSYLQWLGFFRDGQDARDWLVPLLCRGQAVPPTVAHMLLQQFIADGHRNTRRESLGVRVQCPCQAPEHLNGEFDGTIVWTEGRGNAKCVCGASFGFHLNGDVAVVDRIWRYAHCCRGNASQLYHNGCTIKEISTEPAASATTVRRRLGFCQPAMTREMLFSIECQTHREEWLDAVKRAGSMQAARVATRRTYRSLLKYDRDWLMQQSRGEAKRSLVRVNWTVRDNSYLVALGEAAETLRQEVPPRWVSAISVLMVARVPKGTRNQLEKLPKCRALLSRVVETRAQFRERRVAVNKFIEIVLEKAWDDEATANEEL